MNLKEINISDVDNLSLLLNPSMKLKPHYSAGPVYSNIQKYQAVLYLNQNEILKSVYHLSESHFPSLRLRTSYRYTRNNDIQTDNSDAIVYTLNKQFLEFKCENHIDYEIKSMLKRVQDMPKEWTVVQLTALNSQSNRVPQTILRNSTPILYISVFYCGETSISPLCVRTDLPKMNDQPLNLSKNIYETITRATTINFKTENYKQCRDECSKQLKNIVFQMENYWLREWRVLLLGKLVNNDQIKEKFVHEINNIISNINLTEHQTNLIYTITLSSSYLNRREIGKAVAKILPDHADVAKKLARAIGDISEMHCDVIKGQRHPVILLVDQLIDIFPWESCDIFKGQPVSRLPSLHFVYAMYREYKDYIEDGYLTNINVSKGAYVVNPAEDLQNMEIRMRAFYEYWLPEWNGIIGQITTTEDFRNNLVNSDVFVYSGHGSGLQYLPGEEIQKLRVKAIVMLFGCESVSLQCLGGRAEQWGPFDNYLMACSPCVIGNLWKVTSTEMDCISTELLSLCIPSKAVHWKYVNKSKWQRNGEIVVTKEKKSTIKSTTQEPNLLLALAAAKQTANDFLNEAALIARGLPVLLKGS